MVTCLYILLAYHCPLGCISTRYTDIVWAKNPHKVSKIHAYAWAYCGQGDHTIILKAKLSCVGITRATECIIKYNKLCLD